MVVKWWWGGGDGAVLSAPNSHTLLPCYIPLALADVGFIRQDEPWPTIMDLRLVLGNKTT